MLTRTLSVVAQVFLLLSIVLVIAIAVIQINQQQILSPGLKVSLRQPQEGEQCFQLIFNNAPFKTHFYGVIQMSLQP